MLDLKVINSVLTQLEDERGISRAKVIDAIEQALATAYKKEYGKRGQIVRAHFDSDTGKTEFEQVKIVVDESTARMPEEREEGEPENGEKSDGSEENDAREDADGDTDNERVNFNPEHHIRIEDARRIRKEVALGDEMLFPLESQESYGRIAAQTAKQVIIQKIREAEKESVMKDFSDKQGAIVSGTVQRIERGNLFVDIGRATGIIPFEEQIPGERYRQGERIRGYLYSLEETGRGVFLRISRTHPQFLAELFKIETPEVAAGTVEIRSIAREPGSRSKIAVVSRDEHVDPVGSLVGQRGVRVSTVMSELGGEKIDIIEWSENPVQFIEDALSPARVLSVSVNEDLHQASVEVAPDQQSLAIGKGGQNVRLAAKLTGWRIDIRSAHTEEAAGPETVEEKAAGDSEANRTDDPAEEPTQEPATELSEQPEKTDDTE